MRQVLWEGRVAHRGNFVNEADYIARTARTALLIPDQGAQASSRPTPPLVAHIPVALCTDEAAVQVAATPRISFYTRAPFYMHMFELAGFPIGEDGTGTDKLVK